MSKRPWKRVVAGLIVGLFLAFAWVVAALFIWVGFKLAGWPFPVAIAAMIMLIGLVWWALAEIDG